MLFGKWRLTSYLQNQESECGLMCVAAAASILGRDVSATEMRQWFGSSVRGSSVSELCDTANSINLVATPVACELEQIHSLELPAILHWDQKHFCLLLRCSSNHCWIFDPTSGIQRLRVTDLKKHFSGAAIQLRTAAEAEQRRERPKLVWSTLLGTFKEVKVQIGLLLLLSFVLQIASLTLPLLSQVAINLGAMQGNLHAISVIAASMLIIYGINFIVDIWRGRINTGIATRFSESVSRNLFRHLLSLPVEWFQRRRVADVISRFESVDPLRTAVSSGLATLLVDGTLGIAVALGLLIISPTLGLVAVLSVLVTAGVKALFSPAVASSSAISAASKVFEHAKRWETFRAISTLKLASAETTQERAWADRLGRYLEFGERSSRLSAYQQTTASLTNNIGGVAVIYVGATMIANGTLSIGGLFAFVMYRRYLADKVGAAADQISNGWSLKYHLERISEIFHTPKERRWNDRREMGEYISAGSVSFKQVSFRHTSSDPILLRGLDVTINSGEMVCISGPSGLGKTTFLKLISGLVNPSSGHISIDGVSLTNLSPYQLRNAIGAVMQDDELFAGSIFDNITMFSENPQLDGVVEALRGAALWDDVKALPLGVHTPVGEGGRLLSAGQRQRILLARAFYRNPKILLLDEATANLDPKIESVIIDYLKKHSATKLVVSHNLHLGHLADRTFVLDERGLRELGRRVSVAEAS